MDKIHRPHFVHCLGFALLIGGPGAIAGRFYINWSYRTYVPYPPQGNTTTATEQQATTALRAANDVGRAIFNFPALVRRINIESIKSFGAVAYAISCTCQLLYCSSRIAELT